MGDYAIHAPDSIKTSWAILFPVHVESLYLHGPGRSIGGIGSAILASSLTVNTVVVVHIVVSVENPVIFVRLGITKRGYAGAYVIGKESGQLGVYSRQLREV